jgi:hypothetical protein
MPVRTPALFQIEESLPSIRGRRSPNLKAAGYERAKIVICKIPSFGEHRGDLRSISGSDSPDFSNLLIDQVAYVLKRSRMLRLPIENNPTSRTFPKMSARKFVNSPTVTAIAGVLRGYKSFRSPANRSI